MTDGGDASGVSKPKWRVGSKVSINIYEGDRPVCQCHTVEDARRIVEAVNATIPDPSRRAPAGTKPVLA